MSSMGDRIKQIRGPLTQSDFAKRIGVTQRAIVNYEIYGRTPKNSIIDAICEQFKVNKQWLLLGDEPTEQKSLASEKSAPNTCDSVAGHFGPQKAQPIENIEVKMENTCDMSQVSFPSDESIESEYGDRHVGQCERDNECQHVENIDNRENKATDTSAILKLQQELLESLKEQNRLIRENADLRIQLGERDARIRELTKENKALKEALKGTSGVPDNSERAAG